MIPVAKCLVLITLLSSFLFAKDNNKAFKRLFMLEGVWKMNTKKGAICEQWEKVNKNYLQSKGYIIKGNDTIINERVALTKDKKEILYTSTVENQNNEKPVIFKMTYSSANTFIFENPEHDFPRRIVYHLVSADSLHAYIDDGLQHSLKTQHFYYSKQKSVNGIQ